MRILDLASKDLRQILREKQSAFFLLIMPVAFTVLFGFAFGGFGAGGDEDDPRLPVALLNQDGGHIAQQLITLLEQSDVLRLEPATDDWEVVVEQVGEETFAAALLIPPHFAAQAEAGNRIPVTLVVDPSNSAGFTLKGEVNAAATRLNNALETAHISLTTAINQGQLPTASEQEAYFDDAVTRVIAAWSTPPVQVQTRAGSAPVSGGDEGTVYSDNAFAHSSPGMMAQFALAGLITASQILVLERKSGALRRQLTTNMSRTSILVGHYLAMFIIIVAQLLILILFGQFLLKLPYFSEPIATLMLVVASALFAASMGLLIGTLAKSEEQVIIFSLIPMFVLAGLGGAWMPLEFTPASVQRVAYLTPLAWMMDGFKDIIVRGQGVESVLVATAILLLYALVLWLLAAWRFRSE